MRRASIAAALLSAFVVFVFIISFGVPETTTNDAPPRLLQFKELALDANALAQANTSVIVDGIYQGIAADVEMLFSPAHTELGFSDDSVRLLSDQSPREVRQLFYDCRQAGGRCAVRVTGRMGICHLKINESVTFPCLYVNEATARR